MPPCPYCDAAEEDALVFTEDVVALSHPSPLTAFHVVVAPRRHTPGFYDLDVGEQRHIWEVIALLRTRIAATIPVVGFDIGFQDGAPDDPAGHVVLHVIPRVGGAEPHLPGGIEWVALDS